MLFHVLWNLEAKSESSFPLSKSVLLFPELGVLSEKSQNFAWCGISILSGFLILKNVTYCGKLLSMCNCIYQHTLVEILFESSPYLVGEEGSSKNSCSSCKQLPSRYLTEKEYTVTSVVRVVMPERNVALFKRICLKLSFCFLHIAHQWMGDWSILRYRAYFVQQWDLEVWL